ncbi:MAG: murein transglycosylase A [Acidisphaera sp.]|nr:murein transglycosylase A [Acidisphaera sp.]MBV9811522.1 murein transglycosylase A [Acetobacteraceae bacterium]
MATGLRPQRLSGAFPRLRALAAVAALLAGCHPSTPPGRTAMHLEPVGWDALPGWLADGLAAAVPPFREGCAAMRSRSALGGAGEAADRGGAPAQWTSACTAAAALPIGDDAAARAFFEANFRPFAVTAGIERSGLFTGYYEPELAGSRTRGPGFATPLMRPPADLVLADLGAFDPTLSDRRIVGRVEDGQLVPYPDRAAIEAGALRGEAPPLLWVADPIDAFFLEIQGSGRVRLADGSVVRVGYAAENGRPYVPIGRVLIDRGALARDQVSLQTIRAWLVAHPSEATAVMDRNPSYVFFRELPPMRSEQGPPGTLGAPLTPGRSLAVDPSYIPLGAPLWIATTDALDGAPLRRLFLAQDTGGAIKGPVRGDIFWGWGDVAAARAGMMKAAGAVWLLLPR